MRVEITEAEIHEIGVMAIIAADSPDSMKINWEIMSKFLAKLDRPISKKEE